MTKYDISPTIQHGRVPFTNEQRNIVSNGATLCVLRPALYSTHGENYVEICSRFAVFAIETHGFMMLMQLFRY